MDESVLVANLLDAENAEERPLGVQCVRPDQGRDENEHGDAGRKQRSTGGASL